MRHARGFSYPIVMFLVAVLSLVAVRALENTITAERRDQETQLLAVGETLRNAIRSYYVNTPGTKKEYPPAEGFWNALLNDTRTSRLQRHLRKVFPDPVTGSSDWGLVLSLDGDFVEGVFSKSARKPVKSDGFPPDLAWFKGAAHYSQWTFVYKSNGT